MTHRAKVILLFAILLGFQVFSLHGVISRGNRDFIANIVSTTLFWLLYSIIELVKDLGISTYLQILTILVIISDSLLGFYFNFYSLSPPFYDRIQHIVGTYAFALLFYSIITHWFQRTIPLNWIRFCFVAAIGLSSGALYEIVEFFSDTFMSPQIPNQPSLMDTDLDLVSDLIGSIIAGGHSLFHDFGERRFR